MAAGEVVRPTVIAEAANDPGGAIVQGRAIRGFLSESLLDAPANNLGKRQPALARVRTQASRLLLRELDLRSHHVHECNHIMM